MDELAEFQGLSKRDLWRLQARWREVYAAELQSRTGAWVHRGYDWHVFSYCFCECVSGPKAKRELEVRLPTTAGTLVFSDAGNRKQWGAVGQLTSYSALDSLVDVIVAAEDLSWTFAVTHERDCGPYFSRRAWTQNAAGADDSAGLQ